MIVKGSRTFFKNYPSVAVVVSLLVLTLFGTLLLALPWARTTSISLIDLFFTATSLTTATGLLTVPLSNFTGFGQLIVLLLMQIGGLGLMTISLFLIYMFLDLGFYTQVFTTDILSVQNFKDAKKVLFFMLKLTFAAEAAGAIVIFYSICSDYSFPQALFLSIFHAVSAFSNAGFVLFSNELLPFHNNYLLLFITIILIVIGSLGFLTWYELANKFSTAHNKHHKHITWHTKMALKIYAWSTVVSCILIWLLERNNTLETLTTSQDFMNVLFVAISAKSAGFLPCAAGDFGIATLLILIAVMFIGSAPFSTGGGIKTTVFAIYLAVVKAAIKGESQVELQGRRFASEQIYKAMAIIMLSVTWILIISFFLLITETNCTFIDIFLETVSAFSNSGISTGITQWLSSAGKLFISLSMIIGRVGALSIILGIRKNNQSTILYPEEKVLLG
jgi:trk system potassium uptake protein TrkH